MTLRDTLALRAAHEGVAELDVRSAFTLVSGGGHLVLAVETLRDWCLVLLGLSEIRETKVWCEEVREGIEAEAYGTKARWEVNLVLEGRFEERNHILLGTARADEVNANSVHLLTRRVFSSRQMPHSKLTLLMIVVISLVI
jgi:hypothetical protein